MKYLIMFFPMLFFIYSCSNEVNIVQPVTDPGGLLSETKPLNKGSREVMNGIYNVVTGNELFGDEVVVKWSSKRLSIFSGNQGAYGVLEGGRIDSLLYFEGHWRFPFSTSTGLLTLIISADSGAGSILNEDTTDLNIIIEGRYGQGNEKPLTILVLQYDRPFVIPPDEDEFEILAHRGGGRNSDYLGASENSIEILNKAEGLGATGVELDVRVSNDGVAFLYHDVDINLRLAQKGPIWGPIEDYSWPQIRSLITLTNGEKIPSLSEALDFILDETELRTVWLDIKSSGAVNEAVILRDEVTRRGKLKNRNLEIYIGIPTTDVKNSFLAIADYLSTPSLCELSVQEVRELNSEIWAPRWTEGLQIDLVREIQSENRKVFVWTLDEPRFIQTFITDGEFNGILSNYSPLVLFHHYVTNNQNR
jgi:glycerophosphoryl diester phosphodiesterase